jgi:hypothetical protein
MLTVEFVLLTVFMQQDANFKNNGYLFFSFFLPVTYK